MSQIEKMLTYAKAYAEEVLSRNKENVLGIYISGTLAAELQGKISGYLGKRSDVDVIVIGKIDEHEFNWPPEEEWPSICEDYFRLEKGERPETYCATVTGKLIPEGHNLDLINLLQESRDGCLIGLVHNLYPLYDAGGVLEKLKVNFPKVSIEKKRLEISARIFDIYMYLDDAMDLYENERYDDCIFCILDCVIPRAAFTLPYALDVYDTSDKQRFRLLKEISPEIAKLIIEIIQVSAPTREACKKALEKSKVVIEKISAELEKLGYGDLLAARKRLAEAHRFCSISKKKLEMILNRNRKYLV